MEPSQSTKAANCMVGATIPVVVVAGLASAGWITLWAIYAWAARDVAWIVAYGSATVLALALPVAFLVLYDRWQVKRGLFDTDRSRATRALNWACGSLSALLGLLALPVMLLSGYFAWMFWQDGFPAASVYFAVVALATLAGPIAFLLHYDRWQTRNGLQGPSVGRSTR